MRQLRSLVLPFTAVILIPGALLHASRGAVLLGLHRPYPIPQAAGAAALAAVGLWLMVLTVRLFATVGRGTLAPWDPTTRLVVRGPYRRVRNPMIAGVLCLQAAEAIALGSLVLAGWTVFFWVAHTLYFVLSEEPGLEGRFGDAYREYKRHVPRWLPRVTPWTPPEQPT